MKTKTKHQLPEKLKDFKEARHWLTKCAPKIDAMLARRIPVSLFIETALTAIREKPILLKCDPLSLLGGIFQTAQLGLSLGSVIGQAHLIPFETKKGLVAQLMIGYKAYPYLARQENSMIWSECVWEGEVFEYEFGTNPQILHRPSRGIHRMPTDDDLSNLVAVYSVLEYPNGRKTFEILDREDVLKRRACSPSWRSKKLDSPWFTWPEIMARKTAIHAVGRRCGLLSVQKAASIDERADLAGEDRQNLASFAEQVIELPDEQFESIAMKSQGVAEKTKSNWAKTMSAGEGGRAARTITEKQRRYLMAILCPKGSGEAGDRNHADFMFWLGETYGIDSIGAIPSGEFDACLAKAREIAGATDGD